MDELVIRYGMKFYQPRTTIINKTANYPITKPSNYQTIQLPNYSITMKLFTEHPASVNESYFEHLCQAWSFSLRLVVAGLACLVHGLLPFLCEKTGSRAITRLNQSMVENRIRNSNQANSSDAIPNP